jgi:hypothetical protein
MKTAYLPALQTHREVLAEQLAILSSENSSGDEFKEATIAILICMDYSKTAEFIDKFFRGHAIPGKKIFETVLPRHINLLTVSLMDNAFKSLLVYEKNNLEDESAELTIANHLEELILNRMVMCGLGKNLRIPYHYLKTIHIGRNHER